MLNRTTASRIISKQECMVESTDLPLTICSEMIQSISISGSSKVYLDRISKKESYIDAYMIRPSTDENQSFSSFIHKKNEHVLPKIFVPHYVGMNNSPTYPVTSSYARSTLIIHIPWRNAYYHRLDNSSCIKEFYDRMDRCEFPTTVKLNYLQAKHRYEHAIKLRTDGSDDEDDQSDLDEDDRFMLTHMTTLNDSMDDDMSIDNNTDCFHRGIDYNWSQRHSVS
jgi:hypothetical protein